jgi:hypothetical protein
MRLARRDASSMHCSLLPAAFLAVLIAAQPPWAWNKPGHMVTAAIAYYVLKRDDPQTITKVLALLARHPQYADVLKARIESVPAADRDRYAFMAMARWADDVRNQRAYHRGPWHYVNIPIVAPTDDGAFLLTLA